VIPLEALAAADFPKLVISGDHSPAFELMCDVDRDGPSAGRREIIAGRGHTIPTAGAPYNDLLHDFFSAGRRGGAMTARPPSCCDASSSLVFSRRFCVPPAAAEGLRPKTIPALREWTGTVGDYLLPPAPRIVSTPALRSTARRLLSGTACAHRPACDDGKSQPVCSCAAVTSGCGSAQATPPLGPEGYTLSVGRIVSVTANQTAGAFYGTRTLLQLFAQRHTIDAGARARLAAFTPSAASWSTFGA